MLCTKSIRLRCMILIVVMGWYVNTQIASFQVLTTPLITFQGARQEISICFASCSSCTDKTNICDTCFEPWFIRNQNGVCVRSDEATYVQQSTEEQRRAEVRIASSSWLVEGGISPVTTCSYKYDNGSAPFEFNMTGMLSRQRLIYQRSISQHTYYGMKLFMVLSDWCQGCKLNIMATNQNNDIIAQQNITGNDPKISIASQESICGDTPDDKRISITLQVNERNTRMFYLQFTPQIPEGSNASWAVGTFSLITGTCNPSCETCQGFTSNLNQCTSCKNFLANSETQRCSECPNGFYNSTNTTCNKCNIRFQQCAFQNGLQIPQICNFPSLTNTTVGCTFDQINQYTDQTYINDDLFFSSLYTIQGEGSSTLRCGDYSIVGKARFGQFISRLFLNLPPHLEISLSFNIFLIDQDFPRAYTIVIRIDGQVISLDGYKQILRIAGTSNQCQRFDKVEAFATFSTQNFIKHNKTENVKIDIGLGADGVENYSYWGLRDFRLSYRLCDQNCEQCTNNGCIRCKNNLQLQDLQCTGCVGGASLFNGEPDFCETCPLNCVRCNITENAGRITKVCQQCEIGYYVYEKDGDVTCEKNPNFYEPITADNGWVGSTPSSCEAIFYNGSTQNSQGQIQNQQSSRKSFIVAEGRTQQRFSTSPNTFKKKISFYLMKIDNWDDLYLDMYVNDLLVLHKQFNNSGNRICEEQNENQQISFEQFLLQDQNSTTTVQFEVVDPKFWTQQMSNQNVNGTQVPRTAKFGISQFQLQQVGCKECQQKSFNYKLKYNIDEDLKVFVQFNRIYVNDDPQQFKNIFQMQIDGQKTDYQIFFNDSIRYGLRANVNRQIINSTVEVICKYPQRVFSNIQSDQNQQVFFQIQNTRFLQDQSNQSLSSQQNSKTLDNEKSATQVNRFTPLDNYQGPAQGIATFFAIVSRIVIYLGFASFFIGCQTPCTHFMHNLQKIWLHIFVAALSVSPILKTSLMGFRQVQDQNIAINPSGWQAGLPQFLYYDAPAPFQQYYQDINFWRNIYSIGVAFLILIIVYFVMKIISSKILRNKDNSSIIKRHLQFCFRYRPLWYFNSIIFYQYLTVAIACCLQFLDLRNKVSNLSGFDGITAAATLIAFIFITVYPIVFHLILAKKRNSILGDYGYNQIMYMERDEILNQHYIFNNKYSQIFFRMMPKFIWISNSSRLQSIGERHFIYNLLRYGQLWWLAVVTILLFYSPSAQAFVLLLTTAFHLVLVIFFSLSHTNVFKILKSLQLLFFLGLQIIILVLSQLVFTLRRQSYETLGIVAIVFIFIIILLSFIRMIYTFKKIHQQYKYQNQYVRKISNERGEIQI